MSPLMTPERESARKRLDDALLEEEQSAARYAAAEGTEAELGAYVQLSDAKEEVAARDRWLEWAESEQVVTPWPDFLPIHRLLG